MKTKKKPPTKLARIGADIAIVDEHLIELMARRIYLAQKVLAEKQKTGEPIFRSKIESKRLAAARHWAQKYGLNPHFARALLYEVIGESFKQQSIFRDRQRKKPLRGPSGNTSEYANQRRNLLLLTKKWAPIYDSEYGKDSVPTTLYLQKEKKLIDAQIQELDQKGTLVDLGCATGRMTLKLNHAFERSIGYDVSPDMIKVARATAAKRSITRTSFEVLDVESGLPLADESVSFVLMNHGTGSEVKDLPGVLREIERVLQRGGRFFLSFYNSEALLYQSFLPWQPSLNAEIDDIYHNLEVHWGRRIYSVFARAYSMTEIESLMPHSLSILGSSTYPTLSAVFPKLIMKEGFKADVERLDHILLESGERTGSYLIVTGKKT